MFNIVVAMHSIRHNVEVMRKKDENVDARMDVARRVAHARVRQMPAAPQAFQLPKAVQLCERTP